MFVIVNLSRVVPIYALTIAKNGPKLRLSDSRASERPAPRNPALAGGMEPKSGHLVFRNESMADFAWALTRMAGIGDRVVLDHTGLSGRYDFELAYEREREGTLPEGPSLFTALQEQLGLKLASKKGLVEFLTVDHLERPSEN
jgi:uncharacterized protein (TIGR03435 family)